MFVLGVHTEKTKVSARTDLGEHLFAQFCIGVHQHFVFFKTENLAHDPHDSRAKPLEAEPRKPFRNFATIFVRGMFKQNKVVRQLLEPHSPLEKMALDMRQLHREGELDRRDIKAFGHTLRIQDFIFQVTQKAPSRKRVKHPGRRPKMDFYRNLGRSLNMDMMLGTIILFVLFKAHLFC